MGSRGFGFLKEIISTFGGFFTSNSTIPSSESVESAVLSQKEREMLEESTKYINEELVKKFKFAVEEEKKKKVKGSSVKVQLKGEQKEHEKIYEPESKNDEELDR